MPAGMKLMCVVCVCVPILSRSDRFDRQHFTIVNGRITLNTIRMHLCIRNMNMVFHNHLINA